MPNLNYLMRVVRGARFDKMKPILETVKEKSGHSKARTFLSILWCSVRYGAGYYDYAMFGFYAMNGRQRDTYLTRMRNKKVLQAMNDYSYAEEFDDKNRFNKRFAPICAAARSTARRPRRRSLPRSAPDRRQFLPSRTTATAAAAWKSCALRIFRMPRPCWPTCMNTG